MIVHPPTLTCDQDRVILSARIESPPLFEPMPETLWFSFPAKYREVIEPRGDAMAATLLFSAMAFGQELDVRAPLSPRLLDGLTKLQEIVPRLFPADAKRINIQAAEETVAAEAPRGVATAFSGGTDSFYSLRSHLAANEPMPAHRVNYGLFVHGFDIPLEDEKNFETCRRAYASLFQELGLELIDVRTNTREWYPKLEWAWMYAAPLAGAGLALNRLLGRYYVPSGSMESDASPWGEFTFLGGRFSTETLEVVDDPVNMSKADKLFAIADWEPTYDHLRVCYTEINGLENCCRCAKCLTTMAGLEVAGSLGNYSTFPLPLTRSALRGMDVPDPARFIVRRVMIRALARGRIDLATNMAIALARSK